MEPLLHTTIESPIGELLLVGDEEALRGLFMQEGAKPMRVGASWRSASAPFEEASDQLGQYFAGERSEFDLRLRADGSPFQRRVWNALEEIPYGRTVSYGELARRIDPPAEPRAVGAANGRNPISIVVPCHRVIGADGTLTGYGGGIERKRFLLELEAQRRSPRLAQARWTGSSDRSPATRS
jgi:methylated-DNA-[protein]-cysteine S-methyltransferase